MVDAATAGAPPQGVRVRRLLGESALYGLGGVADKAIGFVLLPITTAFLSPEDFGLLSLFGTSASFLFLLMAFGQHQAVAVFNARYADAAHRRRVFAIAVWGVTIVAAFWTRLLFMASQPLGNRLFGSNGAFLFLLLAPATYLQVIRQIGFARLRLQQRAGTYVVVMLISTLSIRGIALYLLFHGAGPMGWLLGEVGGFMLTVLILWPLVFSDLRPVWDPILTKKMAAFGVALTPSQFAHFVMMGADRYVMLATLPDPRESIGLYAVGERVSTIIQLLNFAFALGWQRFAFENLQRADGAVRVARGLTVYVLLGGYATLSLSLLGDDLTHWLMPRVFDRGMQVIPALTLAGFFSGLSELLSVGLQQSGRAARLSLLTMLVAGIHVGLLFVLIPRFGILGAAFSSLSCQALKAVLIWRAAQTALPLPLEYGRLAVLAAVFLGAYLLGQVFIPLGWIVATAGQVAIVVATPLLLLAGGFLRSAERRQLDDMIVRARRAIVGA